MSCPLTSVAFADDEPTILRLLEMSCQGHYQILGTAANGQDAVTLVKSTKPNLLILDVHMPLMDGLEALKHIVPLRTTAVILFTADQDPHVNRQAMDLGASGYLLKPFENNQFIPILETAWHRFQAIQELQNELAKMSDNLETRKLLEKAKGILMEQQGHSEEMAHKMLQKMSQDQGISLKDVCRAVIQVKMVLGKTAQRKIA